MSLVLGDLAMVQAGSSPAVADPPDGAQGGLWSRECQVGRAGLPSLLLQEGPALGQMLIPGPSTSSGIWHALRLARLPPSGGLTLQPGPFFLPYPSPGFLGVTDCCLPWVPSALVTVSTFRLCPGLTVI